MHKKWQVFELCSRKRDNSEKRSLGEGRSVAVELNNNRVKGRVTERDEIG